MFLLSSCLLSPTNSYINRWSIAPNGPVSASPSARTERDIAFVPLTAVSVPGAVSAVSVPNTVMLTVTVPQLEPGVNQIQIQTPSGNLEKKPKNQQDQQGVP